MGSATSRLGERAVSGTPVPVRDPLAAPDEVAGFLGVTEKTLAQWRWRRTGPLWTKVGGRVRYAWTDVESWLEGQRAAI